jgi:hypothetical protein
MNPTLCQSLLKPAASRPRLPAVVASLALASTLLLSACASTGGASKRPLSDQEASYVTTGTYGPKSAQEAGKQSKKSSGASDKFLGDFLGNLAVEGLIRLLIP